MHPKLLLASFLLVLSNTAFAAGADAILLLVIFFAPIPCALATIVFCILHKKFWSIAFWIACYFIQGAFFTELFMSSPKAMEKAVFLGALTPIVFCTSSISYIIFRQKILRSEKIKVLELALFVLVFISLIMLSFFGFHL